MKISENRVCFVNARGKRTCKCFKNGKRVSCNKLRIVPKLDNAAANEIDVGFKLPNIFNMLPFSRKKESRQVTRKGRQSGGSKNKAKNRNRGFFVSANCNKSGKTLKCDHTIGW